MHRALKMSFEDTLGPFRRYSPVSLPQSILFHIPLVLSLGFGYIAESPTS